MTHLICLFITLIIGIVILALLYWVFNMALGLLPAPIDPKVTLAIQVLVALVIVIVITYWLLHGMPCAFPIG